ncbi:HAMP domain-containing sensor histidine kinase [Asanoa sp. NPDC050611]|uniref:sensor histidine kinase n=1 Tax=Asanoa sp. NPDC050611 TaxID=3157098 RepID=UPI0033E6BAEE
MSAVERPRLRARLAVVYGAAAVLLGAVPVAIVGLGAWTGRSTEAVGAGPGGVDAGNTGSVLVAVGVGLVVVALVAAPIGWALAGRALRPLRELTSAASGASADRLPRHGELGRYAEFAALSATLADLYARLDGAYAAQRRFVADASHELRTPLTAQRALIQLTLTDPDADTTSMRAALADLLRNGEQQERLVAGLLALAQGQQGRVTTEPVDLAALVARALAARDPAPVMIHTDLEPAVVAEGDPTLLASLVGNLLDNAIRHNVDGGRVDVGTRRTPGLVDRVGAARHGTVLTISNTGPVVPADAVDRILTPFQRLTTPRTGTAGSGLGLAIVRAIAEAHGADLRVTPHPGGGLTVTVTFAAGGQVSSSERPASMRDH